MIEPRMISLIRYGLLGAIAVLSLIVLAIAGHLISLVNSVRGAVVPDYLGLDLAIGLLTIIVIAVSLGVDFFRRGAFTSMVAVELGWSFVFMVFWIACSGTTTATWSGVSCSDRFVVSAFDDTEVVADNQFSTICHEAQALTAFAWLNWLMLSSWVGLLATLALVSHNRGNTSVWTSPVVGTDFYAYKQGGVQPQYTGAAPQQYGAPQPQYAGTPMQQQYTGTPVQTQYTGSPQPTSYPPGAAQV